MSGYLTYKFHIPMGLPGSGKSYYGKTVLQNDNDLDLYGLEYFYIDLDKHKDHYKDIEVAVEGELYKSGAIKTGRWSMPNDQHIYIDGLILTKEELEKVILTCIKFVEKHSKYSYDLHFVIHLWKEDREICINNDRIRVNTGEREASSETSIRNLKFDNITKKDVEQILFDAKKHHVNVQIKNHDVYELTEYSLMMNKYGSYKNKDVMVSDSWSKGGTWGSCWSDDLSTITPDSTPEFKEFDDMLSEICPNITFLQYKKLYNECVKEVEYDDNDYYGGTEYRAYWSCDLKKLHKMLLEMKIIK